MLGLCRIILTLLKLYEGVIFVYCIFSMLYSFGILDGRNRIVWRIGEFLNRLVEPVLNPIRRIMPALGNVDLSPLILLLVLRYIAEPLVVEAAVAVYAG
ncbi:YggT family protein [Acetobacter oeni]|nr:YggT family protein [Acetobacter oeni]NHO19008.1 YggT family protein [Acetobacter oeni]